MTEIDVFQYTNYRQFLRDYYLKQKEQKTGFTYSSFARSVGLGSPNYYKLVMDGEKNLTPENVIRFAGGFKFDANETDFFEALVNYNQAKNSLEQDFYREKMVRLKRERARLGEHFLGENDFSLISHWMFPAIFILSHLPRWKNDLNWIKDQLNSQVSIEDIRYALEKLQEVGLLVEVDEQLKPSQARVKTTSDISGFSGKLFYQSVIHRARKLFESSTAEERELSSYTIGLSPSQLPELRQKVRSFMSELNDWILENKTPSVVYNFTFLGFPMSKGGDL